MSQVALKMIDQAPVAVTWEMLLASVRSAATVQAVTGTDDKAAKDALKSAERLASWHVFDVCQGDADAAQTLAEALAEAKGASDAVVAVMRQRARDMVTTYAAGVAKANREKSSPLTVAKRLREQRDETDALKAARRPYNGAAAEHVAAQLGPDWDATRVLAEKADDATLQAAFDEAIDALMTQADLRGAGYIFLEAFQASSEETQRALLTVVFEHLKARDLELTAKGI